MYDCCTVVSCIMFSTQKKTRAMPKLYHANKYTHDFLTILWKTPSATKYLEMFYTSAYIGDCLLTIDLAIPE